MAALGSQPDQTALGNVSLVELLDRVLNKGVVVFGEVLISVADVDLIYLSLQVVLTSVETLNGIRTGVRDRIPADIGV